VITGSALVPRNPVLWVAAQTYGWGRYRKLSLQDSLPHRDMAALQSDKLARLLRHAASSVPYYRDLLAERGVQMNGQAPRELLSQLPLLTKQDVVTNFPDRILAHGKRAAASKHITSTGTTSDRIDIVLDLACQNSRHGLELWCYDVGGSCRLGARRLEIPPDACSRECGVNAHRPVGFMDEVRWAAAQSGRPVREWASVAARRARYRLRRALLNDETLPPFGPDGTRIAPDALQSYVDAISEKQPYLLTGLPTYLHEIARHIQRTGQSVHVPVIRPIGSVSTPRLKRLIGEAFGGDVFETYGSNELGPIAVECSEHRRLHVAMGSYVVEVLRNGEPAAEGELGHIVVTCLDNYSMPLIRYKLGDVGRWHSGPCECGRESQLIECNGRLQDLIVCADGSAVTEEEIMEAFYFDHGLDHFQLVERKRGAFDLMVLPAPGQELDLETLREAAGDLLGNPKRLDVFPVDTIYPEATGKFRFVKSASYEDFA